MTPSGTQDAPGRLIRVSIVIPCFNHAHFLGEAIESAANQSWPNLQVVVVDDGSTDSSAGVARRYPSVVLLQQENRGLAAARNAGLRRCDGDVVIFLDADDRLWPDAARIAVAAFEAHPDAGMVFGHCRVIDATGAIGPATTVRVQGCAYEDLLRDNSIWTPAMAAFKREVLDAVGVFDENNSPAADYDLYLRISRSYPVISHGNTVVDYRQHAHNMSRDPVLMLNATMSVLRAQAMHVKQDPRRRAAYQDALANWRACYGERLVERFRVSWRERRYRAALADAGHLLRLYPAGVKYHITKKLSLMLRGPGDPPKSVADSAQP